MYESMKTAFSDENFSGLNSVILNNYSIQNVIISPTKIVNYDKKPLFGSSYIISNKSAFSPSPPKTALKKFKAAPRVIQKNPLRNPSPFTSYKSASRINLLKYKTPVISPVNSGSSHKIEYTSPKIMKIEEKHPQDSTSKNIKMNKIQQIILKTEKKLLKSSISQRLFRNIKKPVEISTNLSVSQSINRNEKNKHVKNLILNNLSASHVITRNGLVGPLYRITKKVPSNSFSFNANQQKIRINLEEFQIVEQIGKGTFGNIFCVIWNKNKKLYALKKEVLTDRESVQRRREVYKIIQNFVKETKSKGLINLYGNLLLKKKEELEYQYYELMEKAERDWNQEINIRSQFGLYYDENEILNIMEQLISILSLLQKNHITHRDIKPQNILVINGKYKLCDFGEIRILKRDGLIVQRVRGSELYMSPILFNGLHLNFIQVKHNTYKSDVFSLGMCFFYACCLNYSGVDSIREMTNMQKIKEILFSHLSNRYSFKFLIFILQMLEINEDKRPDFIQLEIKFKKLFHNIYF
jgi:hypothetical protein